MRKLLLNSTALFTAAALTSGIALADVNVTASTEWKYRSIETKFVNDNGTKFDQDSEIKFSFSNKTDSGLTIGYVVEMESDTAAGIDESSLSIAGGFGKFVLGQNDNVSDNYAMTAMDGISEEGGYLPGSATVNTSSEIADADDANKIAYHMPAMGGLTAGISWQDSGVGTTDTNTAAFGASYKMDTNGVAIQMNVAAVDQNQVATATVTDIKKNNMGIKITSGNYQIMGGRSHTTAFDESVETSDFSLLYKLSDDIKIGAYVMSSEDSKDTGEKYTKNGLELQYTIAPGLKAFLNHDVFEYTLANTAVRDTTGGTTADSGSESKFTVQATF